MAIPTTDMPHGDWCYCSQCIANPKPATEELIARRSAAACSVVVGHWTPVTDSMPDDEITVLVWVESLDDATLAYHDTEIKDRRGDSGWIMAGTSRVLLGVTHWCEKINPPNAKCAGTDASGKTL